ncbi:MAG: hypothetical protein E7004_00400 [Alphaproteobacteria bacterium]|nr:hypothetical protein [Alphaproteobacteria bacterium]
MILQIFICLLMMAFCSLLITQGRRRKIWSVLLLFGLGIISYFFVISLNAQPQGSFIYQWLPYNILKADFNISDAKNIQQMLRPLIIMLLGLVYLNTISKGEQHSLHFNTLLILNFIALILMLSSHDFLQLMFAGCMFSVIGFYMPDSIAPKKNLFIFYFLAETAIFIAFAVVYGSTRSISLADMSLFVKNGQHKDIVSGLLLFAIACKSGLFLLNEHYFNLKHISSNRIVCTMLTSVPVSALVLLIKIKPLLNATSLVPDIFPYWIGLSIVVCLLFYLFNNNLKTKIISLLMSAIAFSLHFIYKNSDLLYDLVPYVLCVAFLISLSLILVFNSASKEPDISYIGGFWRITKLNFVLNLLLGITSLAILSRFPLNKYENIYVICLTAVVFAVLRRIFLTKPCDNNVILANAKSTGILYALPLAVISGWFLWQTKFWNFRSFYILFAIAVFMLILAPTKIIDIISSWKIWQNSYLTGFYENIFIRPLRLFGRILWLAFDVMVVERSIVSTISHLSKAFVGGMHKIQESGKYSYLLSIVTGALIIIVYFLRNIYK